MTPTLRPPLRLLRPLPLLVFRTEFWFRTSLAIHRDITAKSRDHTMGRHQIALEQVPAVGLMDIKTTGTRISRYWWIAQRANWQAHSAWRRHLALAMWAITARVPFARSGFMCNNLKLCAGSGMNANGKLVVNRGTSVSCSSFYECGGLSTNSSVNSFWEQCCTTNLCNNVAIPVNVTSLAALEQLYLGMTPAECYGNGAHVLLSLSLSLSLA